MNIKIVIGGQKGITEDFEVIARIGNIEVVDVDNGEDADIEVKIRKGRRLVCNANKDGIEGCPYLNTEEKETAIRVVKKAKLALEW